MPAPEQGEYAVVSPSGQRLKVPWELYDALSRYIGNPRARGEIVLTLTSGGVAGVKIVEHLK